VRLSRSWFGGLVKAAMRAAKRGPNGRGRVAAIDRYSGPPTVNVSSQQAVRIPTDKPNPA